MCWYTGVPDSQTVSSTTLDNLQSPSEAAVTMDRLARTMTMQARTSARCAELPRISCDKNMKTRYSNGSCNNLDTPYQVLITMPVLSDVK